MWMKCMIWYTVFLLCTCLTVIAEKPWCTDPDIKIQPCAKNDTYCGDWVGRKYIPNNCKYREFTNEQARQCVGSRTIACIGDSIIRDMCIGLAMYLSGEKVEEGLDYKFDRKAEIHTHYTNATKIGSFSSWSLNKDNYNGLLFPKVDGDVKPDWKWQVQVWELHANVYLYDHHVEDVLMNKMAHHMPELHPIDFAFWGHGLHDWGWFDTHPHGARFYDAIVSIWKRVRDTVPTPVVWTPINPHCLELDPLAQRSFFENRPGGFAKQVHMAHEANYYTRKALREEGLPYYDSAAPLRSPQICNVSSDGVHVKMWVDLVRAQIMLNHLCDENYNWVADISRF
mmetsp:Transcript_2340/g.4930  ORF Transcript_2340/g.4930 Transcript_2340/m.4930 type:complete len:340 (-) Transcript_2340:96-1115(-)